MAQLGAGAGTFPGDFPISQYRYEGYIQPASCMCAGGNRFAT